ncbi:hypothetical protein AB3G45_07015 [Shinella sp. S4-D37]|uniref:hypothetical protein n=1 Tax=Shinella sp. S4-D37 TaxID=3161999 RepID=UPI003465E2C3
MGNAQRRIVTENEAALVEKPKSKGKAAFVEALKPVWDNEKDVFGPALLAIMDSCRK